MTVSDEPPASHEEVSGSGGELDALRQSLGLIAHELNGALTIIGGSLQGLTESVRAWADAPAKVHRALDYARRGAERVEELAARLQAAADEQKVEPDAVSRRTNTRGPLAPVAGAKAVAASILLVDDDDDVRDYIVEALQELNYQVSVARNAEEAIERLENASSPFDVMLTDMMLPGTGGHGLAQEAVKRRPKIGVLLMSGQSRQAFAPGTIPSHMDMIAKPMTKAALDDGIKRALRARPGGA